MKEQIDEQEIRDILRNRDQKLKVIEDKRTGLYQELNAIQDMRPADVLPSAGPYGHITNIGSTRKDLDDVYENFQKQTRQRELAIREILWELKEREETILHVWDCLYILDEVYYSVLYGLYVEGLLYTTVEADHKKKYEISHMTFERYRKEGLELLMHYYNSGCSIPELMRMNKMTATHSGKRKGLKVEGSAGYTQISLLDLMGNEKQTEAKEGK